MCTQLKDLSHLLYRSNFLRDSIAAKLGVFDRDWDEGKRLVLKMTTIFKAIQTCHQAVKIHDCVNGNFHEVFYSKNAKTSSLIQPIFIL